MSNVLKMHALKTVTDEVVTQKDIDKVMKKLEAARDEDPEDFGFVSSDYKKPEIVESSDSESEETNEFEEQEMSAFQLSVRDSILGELVETGKVDTKSKAFQNLRYSDQLGILDEVRDSFKFDRSYLTGYIHEKKKKEQSQKSQEEQDKEFSQYQLDGLLSRNNIRKEIRRVEDESKKNKLRDVIENSQGKLRQAGRKYALFEQEEEEPKEKVAKSIFDLEDKKEDKTGTLSESSSEDEFVSDDSEYEVTPDETIKVPCTSRHNILGLNSSIGDVESSSTSDIVDIEIPESILKMARLAAQKREAAAKIEADFKNKILESSDSSDVQFVHDGKVRKSAADTLKSGDTPQLPLCALRKYLDESEDFVDVTEGHKIEQIDEKSEPESEDVFVGKESSAWQKKFSPEEDESTLSTTETFDEGEEAPKDEIKEKKVENHSPELLSDESGEGIKEEKELIISEESTMESDNNQTETKEETAHAYFNAFMNEAWERILSETVQEETDSYVSDVLVEESYEIEVIEETFSSIIRSFIEDITALSFADKMESEQPHQEAKLTERIEDFTAASILEENAIQIQKLSSAVKLTAIPSQQLYKDAAEMLTLFGCGVFFAPGEAEAQCAEFEINRITQGTITDDGDTFLFGGKVVIKGLTLGNMVPIKYDIDETDFSREYLIALAQLTGSDYCGGIKSVGSKTALKILEEFDDRRSDDPHLTLNTFAKWWKTHHKSLTTGTNGIPLRSKLKKLNIDADFPSDRSRHAYLYPNVEKLKDKKIRFTVPDLERIRRYALRKLEWQEEMIDQHIIPLLPEKVEKRKDIRFYMNAK